MASTTSSNGPKITLGTASSKGRRKRNEDALVALQSLPDDPTSAFVAVYDGHGGKKCAIYCKCRQCPTTQTALYLFNSYPFFPLTFHPQGSNKVHSFMTAQSCYATNKKEALYNAFVETDAHYLKKPTEDGATALAVLIGSDNSLIVANAGDSRCILCTDGKATALTKDHKPGDDTERQRIERAGFLVMKSTEVVKGKQKKERRKESRNENNKQFFLHPSLSLSVQVNDTLSIV
jgi:protein phosphatase 2C family protein 2/3